MIWLDADTLIREKTNGAKSLNDFTRAFFGIYDGSYITATYQFDDVVHALNGVYAYDWATFLRTRPSTATALARRSMASAAAATTSSSPTSKRRSPNRSKSAASKRISPTRSASPCAAA